MVRSQSRTEQASSGWVRLHSSWLSLTWLLGMVQPLLAQQSPGQPSVPPTAGVASTLCDPSVLPTQPISGNTTPAIDSKLLEKLPEPSKDRQLPKNPEAVRLASKLPLTLEQSVELANRRNRDLEVARLGLEQQKFVIDETKAALYPSVGFQAGITRSDSANAKIGKKQQIQAIEEQIAAVPVIANPTPAQQALTDAVIQGLRDQITAVNDQSTSSNFFTGSVNLNYDVFTSGQRSARIKGASAALKGQQAAYRTEFEQLRLDVANDYYDLLTADDLVRIAQQSVADSEENLRVTKAREQAGVGTRFEVLQAEVQLGDQRQQLVQAQNQQLVAQRQLAQRLSLPDTITVEAADPVAMSGQWDQQLENSILSALNNRSELEQVRNQREVALQNRRIALGSLGPQLTFNASMSIADELTDKPLGAYGYAIGAEVSKTIFDGGAAKATAKQEEINTAIADTQFSSFKNTIRFQVEQNYYTLQSSRARIGTNRCAVQQAEEALKLAKLRRDFGVGTTLEVINAETELSTARGNYLQSVIDYNRSLEALKRFVGKDTPRPQSAPPSNPQSSSQ
jgi:outer membrane factor, OMF family